MNSFTVKISDFLNEIPKVLFDEFDLSPNVAKKLSNEIIKPHINQLKKGLNLLVETEYIDKVYRDSYYKYYSTKLFEYNRDCIRVSIFDCEINYEMFRNADLIEKNKEHFLGFFVLRPTDPYIIGRSIISTKALAQNNIKTCFSYIPTSINSIKFDAVGFPHSSQDTETITCAETTLWSIFEYFGNKYPEYKPILPSQILQTLKNVTHERQLPSKGLQINQISYVLKEYGLASKVYSRSEYGSDFDKLISMYIEGGIPLILSLDNIRYLSGPGARRDIKYIGHAVLCVGRAEQENYMIDSLAEFKSKYEGINKLLANKKIKFFDSDEIRKQFVFIDDNKPIYQKAFLNNPASNYADPSWNMCEISHFIAPLYKKVYLEAFQAKNFAIKFLLDSSYPISDNREIVLRSFLTSSRSYKQYISLNSELSDESKDEILDFKTPKLIWVFELSNKESSKKNLVEGLILIDATEPNTYNYKPLLLAIYDGSLVKYTKANRCLERFPLILQPFSKFESNLK